MMIYSKYFDLYILYHSISYPCLSFTAYQINEKAKGQYQDVTGLTVFFQFVGPRKKLKEKGKLIVATRAVGHQFISNEN